jgi:glyoxylase-like metal-dependent hydrolase (beta-lactamase superfamily II)
VAEASSFADDEILDVPGRPRVIYAPGHAAGNAALSLEDREALVVGDTLATISLESGETRPQLPPRFMNDDHDRALASLQKIELVTARRVLPGHGLPWREAHSMPSSWPGKAQAGQVEHHGLPRLACSASVKDESP